MLSVEKKHPVFAENCHCLRPGQSSYSLLAEIPFDLHRYADGWHVYWKNPPNSQIGRHIKSRLQLSAFLAGNWRVGTVIQSPVQAGMLFKRSSPRRK
jgi:hypothetical protein